MYTSPRTGTAAKEQGALATGLNNLQQIAGLLEREGADELLVQNQEICSSISDQTFLQLAAAVCNAQLVQKFLIWTQRMFLKWRQTALPKAPAM